MPGLAWPESQVNSLAFNGFRPKVFKARADIKGFIKLWLIMACKPHVKGIHSLTPNLGCV